MKELTVGKLKAGFSRIIDDVLAGESYTVLRGKNKQKVAMIVPVSKKKTGSTPIISRKRTLGRDKGKIIIKPDFDDLPDDVIRAFGIE